MIEYDETLGQDLVNAGFDVELVVSYSMMSLFAISNYDYGPMFRVLEKIKNMRHYYLSGCIWAMPIPDNHASIIVNGMCYILLSRKSSKEIRQIIKMKAFL